MGTEIEWMPTIQNVTSGGYLYYKVLWTIFQVKTSIHYCND